jgi:hypothetical protein
MLLEGSLNNSKSDTLPSEWMKEEYPNPADRKAAAERHDLVSLPSSPQEFAAYFEGRKEKMRGRLTVMLA